MLYGITPTDYEHFETTHDLPDFLTFTRLQC
jgi:hypothetical protein